MLRLMVMARLRATWSVAVALPFLLGGCSADRPTAQAPARVDLDGVERLTAPSPRDPSPVPEGTLTDSDCSGDCNAAFVLDGRRYLISCSPIPPSSLSPTVKGKGEVYGRQVDVREIVAGPRAGSVAIGPAAFYCNPGQPPPDWYLYAYPI